MKIKKNSILVGWLISYLIFTLIFSAITVLIYQNSKQTLLQQIDTSHTLQIQRASENINNIIDGAKSIGAQIILSKYVKPFLNVKAPLTYQQRYDALALIDELRLFEISNNALSQIAIYLKEADVLITTNGILNTRTYFNIEYNSSDTDYHKFLNLFSSQIGEVLTTVNFEGELPASKEHQIIYIRGIDLNKPMDLSVSIFITINPTSLFRGIYSKEDPSTIFNVLYKGNLLASTGYLSNAIGIDFTALTDPSIKKTQMQGKNLVVFSHTSDNHLSCMSITQRDNYLKSFHYIRYIMVFSALLGIILAVVLSFYFSRKNYVPIRGLIRNIAHNNYPTNLAENEYAIINNAVDKMLSEKQHMNFEIEKKDLILKRRYLTQLLKGQVDDPASVIRARFAKFHIKTEPERYMVLLLGIQGYNVSQEDMERKAFIYQRNDIQLILTNVFEELINKYYNGYMGELDETLISCLINIGNTDPTKAKQELLSIVEQPKNLIETQFSLQYIGSLSNVGESIEDLCQLYNEAQDTIKYMQTMGIEQSLSYGDIVQDAQSKCYYPRSIENRLFNLIEAGDYTETMRIIDDLFDRNFGKNKKPSVQLVEDLSFKLTATLMQITDETGIRTQNDAFNPIKQLIPCKGLQNMKDALSNYLKNLCVYMAQQNVNNINWIQRDIIPYIQQHSNDANLNVASLAGKFDIHPVYLSRVFKEECNESILDYINHMRIENSKCILRETKMNIEDVALQIGFSNVRTFTRVFKKYEGITPGKYREIYTIKPSN